MNKDTTKKLHIIYGSIIGALIILIIAGALYYLLNYKKDTAAANKAYENAKSEYEEAHSRILEEEKMWKAELVTTHDEANSMAAELAEIYKERQEEKDAEDARWNSLTSAEKQAEKKCEAYNEMVSYLRKNNPSYAKIYVEYASYLDQDIFNLDSDKLLDYTNLYDKKIAIEKKYMETHPF